MEFSNYTLIIQMNSVYMYLTQNTPFNCHILYIVLVRLTLIYGVLTL